MTELQLTPNLPAQQDDARRRRAILSVRVFFGLFIAIALICVASLIALPILANLFQLRAFRCSAGSMCPTICLDERFVASMNAYRGVAPKRGDVIMHSVPPDAPTFIKRVIGVAGDTVSPGPHNEVLVNGKPLILPSACGNPVREVARESENPAFTAVKIPDGSLFVIGNDLLHSYDSGQVLGTSLGDKSWGQVLGDSLGGQTERFPLVLGQSWGTDGTFPAKFSRVARAKSNSFNVNKSEETFRLSPS